MSGGSLNYVYCKIQNELCDNMGDKELDELMEDIAELAHDREWYLSSDIGKKQYYETVNAFKKKWFKGDRTERLKKYIDEELSEIRNKLMAMIGDNVK